MAIHVGYVPAGYKKQFMLAPVPEWETRALLDHTTEPPRVVYIECFGDDTGARVYAFEDTEFSGQLDQRFRRIRKHNIIPENLVAQILPQDHYEQPFTVDGNLTGRLVLTHVIEEPTLVEQLNVLEFRQPKG